VIIIDNRISSQAKKKLSSFGDLMELKTDGITYEAISGHPDIFFCQSPGKLFVCPEFSATLFDQLNQHNIDFIKANCRSDRNIHHQRITMPLQLQRILSIISVIPTLQLPARSMICSRFHVDQGYCRCNLLPLKDDHFITSDMGIYKVLKGLHLFIHYIDPMEFCSKASPTASSEVAAGIWKDKVFINGSLKAFHEGEKVRKLLEDLSYEIVELTDWSTDGCGEHFVY